MNTYTPRLPQQVLFWWRSVKHWWFCHTLSTHLGKRWFQAKLNQRPSTSNNQWIWRLYDSSSNILLTPLLLLWDDLGNEEYLKALTLGIFSICRLFTWLKPSPSLQLDFWVAYLLMWLYLLLPSLRVVGPQQRTITSYFSGGPTAPAPGSTVSKQSSAVSHSGGVHTPSGWCHCH